MRQTYKPLKRKESKAFALNKKTLTKEYGHHIPLDDDEMENIDQYWKTAEYELGEDKFASFSSEIGSLSDLEFVDELNKGRNVEEVKGAELKDGNPINDFSADRGIFELHDKGEKEPGNASLGDSVVEKVNFSKCTSPLKYRKSFDNEFVKDFNTANISGMSESVIGAKDRNADGFFKEEGSEDASYKLSSQEENVDDDSNIPSSGSDTKSVDESFLLNKMKKSVKLDLYTMRPIEDKRVSEETRADGEGFDNCEGNVGEESLDSSNKRESAHSKQEVAKSHEREDDIMSTLLEFKEPADERDIVVPGIEYLHKEQDGLNFLLRSGDMETGILYLSRDSFIKEEKASQSFSIYVIKGSISVEVGKHTAHVKKGGMALIRRGWIYSLRANGKRGNSLFVSYAI
jgi:hypothetical protein